MGALTPIDQVIRQLCRETGEPDFKNYDTILSHVRGALVDLQLYVLPSVKTVEMKANQLRNIAWPCDCVKPLLIGIKRNNSICNISVDSGISSVQDCGCSSMQDVEADINAVSSGPDYGQPYSYDGAKLEGYGTGYDSIKACTHDKELRITNIKFQIQKNDSFQFTYISDGISGGVTHVPVEAETPIGEWVFWKYYRRTNPGLSDRGRINYKEESTRLRKLYNDQTLDDWIKAIVRR